MSSSRTPCRVERFRFRADGLGLLVWGFSVFSNGNSGAEVGRRREDLSGFQTRDASEPNLASWRPGLRSSISP